ncbi:MAG: PHP domain-containing protein [Gemmatimonadales bacterium]|nr:MAG: PHP domain-containing protein [Gemmatimonadales bacterium]
MALTDHDTIAGVPEAVAEGERLGLAVVCGCAFSVKVAWGEMHLLGYFLPLGNLEMDEFLATARRQRVIRAERMIEGLQAWGVDIHMADVLAEARQAAVGRPHVARALVRHGKVADVQSAFDEFLGLGRRAYVEKVLPTLSEVADLVHQTGGLVSAAHLRDKASRSVLSMLKQEGLDAVEVNHPSHSPEITRSIAALAEEVGLRRSGGSDWHGDGSPDDYGYIGTQSVPMAWLDELRDGRGLAPPSVEPVRTR